MLHHPLGGPLCSVSLRGGGQQNRSRGAPARPRLANHNAKNRFASGKKREAERRKAHPTNSAQHRQTLPLADARARRRAMQTSTQSAHLSACGARSPSGATPRLSPGLSHPGSAPGHACWDRSGQAFYPPFPVPSPVEAPHASAVVPKGMMPEAAPAQVASLRGSTALAPHFRSHPECVPR